MFLKIFLFILLSISCLAEQLSFPGVKFTNLLLPQLGKLAVDTDVIKKIYKEDKDTALCKLVKSFYNLQDGVIKKTALPGKPAISLTPDLLAKLLLTLDNKYDKNSLIKEWNSYHKKVAGHNLKNWEYNRIIKLFNEALLDSSKKDLNGLPVAVLTGILALDPEYKNNFAEFTKTLSDLAGNDYLDLTCAEIPYIFSDKNYPPKFNSIYLGYKGRRAVPTCVEDALRNIIYAVFWNPDTKELDFKQINPQVKLNKNFIKFIENYKTDLISTEAAQVWMDLVSGIPGVLYFRDKYELQGDIENGFKVLSFLFQSDINSWNDFFDVIKVNHQHSFSGNSQHKGFLYIDKLNFKIEVDVSFWNTHSSANIYHPNSDESKEKNYKFLESCLSINNPTKNQRLVSYLLFNKIIPDINALEQLRFRYTPLHFALSRNRLEISKMLIEHGADANAKGGMCGETPLHLAVKKGNLEIVRLLIEHGADVNARNQEGNTPLHFAASCNRLEISKLLIEHGADLNAANSDGYTALMLAARDGHKAVVNRLIESGANLNAANSNGYTALVLAARDGHESVVNRLIEAGADVNTADSYGNTALILAALSGHEAFVNRLIEAGANLSAVDIYGNTALMLAARFGHEAVVNRLIEAGANLSAVDIDGNTALMLAARRGREAVVNRLIEAGADLNAANCWNGDTPLYTALKYKFIGFVNLLKSYKFKK